MSRDPQNALEALAYYADCQIATLEVARMRKRTPKHDRDRHESIARGMLAHCDLFGLDDETLAMLRDRFDRAVKA